MRINFKTFQQEKSKHKIKILNSPFIKIDQVNLILKKLFEFLSI